MDFNVTDYEIFIDMVSDCASQLTFLNLTFLNLTFLNVVANQRTSTTV